MDINLPGADPVKRLEAAVKDNAKGFLLKVNVDDAPKISRKYAIASLPTVFAIRNSEVVGSFIGSQHPSKVKKFVDIHTGME